MTIERSKPNTNHPPFTVLRLADYAPLSDIANQRRLIDQLTQLQAAQGDSLMITSEASLLETLPIMTNGKHNPGNGHNHDTVMEQSTPTDQVAIPEIDELDKRLAAVEGEDVAAKRAVIIQWYFELPESELRREHREKRRRREEVAADELAVKEWVTRLNNSLHILAYKSTHISQAARDYNILPNPISKWHNKGQIIPVGFEKNRILFNEKDLAIALIMNKRFSSVGSGIVPYALRYYKTLQNPPSTS